MLLNAFAALEKPVRPSQEESAGLRWGGLGFEDLGFSVEGYVMSMWKAGFGCGFREIVRLRGRRGGERGAPVKRARNLGL